MSSLTPSISANYDTRSVPMVAEASAEPSDTALKQRTAAAIKIQSLWRGCLGRAEAENANPGLLSYTLFQKAKFHINTPDSIQTMQKADAGATSVFLPAKLPVVLKHSGFPENLKRQDQMNEARRVCDQIGSKHLIIPRARTYKDYIIETRLPIDVDYKYVMGLYSENREQFTDAVKEFTAFLCSCSFSDLEDGTGRTPYDNNKFSTERAVRYDNVCLYIQNGKGYLGLIDLEHFHSFSNPTFGWAYTEAQKQERAAQECLTALRFFPHHLDEILSVAKQFDPEIEKYRAHFEQVRDELLKRLKLAYENHAAFIQAKGITLENPAALVEVTQERRDQIKAVIEQKLRNEHTGEVLQSSGSFRKCLGKNPDATIATFNEEIFPEVLDASLLLIQNLLKDQVKRRIKKQGTITSKVELAAARTIKFGTQHIRYQEFSNSITPLLRKRLQYSKFDKIESLILTAIIQDLVKHGELAAYYQNLGRLSDDFIFC